MRTVFTTSRQITLGGNWRRRAVPLRRWRAFVASEEAGTLVRAVLLEASENRVPTVDSDADERFVDPMWGSPAARVDAAAGLMTILRHPSCDDSDVLAAVERLIADPAPCVRYQIASRLMFRYAHDPEWTWRDD